MSSDFWTSSIFGINQSIIFGYILLKGYPYMINQLVKFLDFVLSAWNIQYAYREMLEIPDLRATSLSKGRDIRGDDRCGYFWGLSSRVRKGRYASARYDWNFNVILENEIFRHHSWLWGNVGWSTRTRPSLLLHRKCYGQDIIFAETWDFLNTLFNIL